VRQGLAVAQLAGSDRVGLGRLGQHRQAGAIGMLRGGAGKRIEHGGRSLGGNCMASPT
jgi:hypothetical protein